MKNLFTTRFSGGTSKVDTEIEEEENEDVDETFSEDQAETA